MAHLLVLSIAHSRIKRALIRHAGRKCSLRKFLDAPEVWNRKKHVFNLYVLTMRGLD